MDVSVSKEFINVYKQISKLQDDIAKVGKDCYEVTLHCDDIAEVPENLSEFNNDAGFITNEELTSESEHFLLKDGVEKQTCEVTTEFEELHATTKDADDSSTNVATTLFVHNLVQTGNDKLVSCLVSKSDTKNFVTLDSIEKSEQRCKLYADVKIDDVRDELSTEISQAVSEINVPTKTSDLDNDSGFITIGEVPGDLVTSVNGQTGNVLIDIPTIPEIPTKLSQFTNDVGYITDPGVTSVNNRTGAVSVLENVLADWSATSGLAQILHKPALKRVATTGDYNDLDNLPDLTTKVDKILSTDNAVVRFDGTLGNIQDSDVIIDDDGDIITDNSIYLTTVYLSVHTQGNSRLYFGSKQNTIAYIAANSAGSFGMYNDQGKGFSCQPTLNFFSTSNIDLGRAGNSWKNFYFTGLFYRGLYDYAFPDKSGTIALTSDIFSGDYNDLINTPTIPVVPTNVSAFTNDAGYITEQYLFDDLATVAISGDYADIKNTPEIPTVPKNISAFVNNVGYLTAETDPTVPSWAKQLSKPSYTAQEVGALPSDTLLFSGDYNDLQNKPTIPVIPNIYSHNIAIEGDNTTRIYLTLTTTFATSFDVNSLIAYINNLSGGGFMCSGTVRTNSSGIATGRTAARIVPGNTSDTIGIIYHDTGDAGTKGPIYYSAGTGANKISNVIDTIIPII